MDCFKASKRLQFRQTTSGSRDGDEIFTAHERAHLVMEIFDTISIASDTELVDHLLKNSRGGQRSTNLRYILQSQRWIDVLTPLHVNQQKFFIQQKTWYPLWRLTPPVDGIQDYYGPQVAYYFAFMGFLGNWLLFLGFAGLLTFLQRLYRNDTIDEDEFTPFYGIFCFLWAVLFARFWERQEFRLAYRWGTLQVTALETGCRDSGFESSMGHQRPQFRGHVRTSPITGRPELYYSSTRRKLHYVISALVTIAMLSLVFWAMVMSLNLQGYIVPKKRYHPFHFPSLAGLAAEGQLFDSSSGWKSYIPVFIHVVCIALLNYLYRVCQEVD